MFTCTDALLVSLHITLCLCYAGWLGARHAMEHKFHSAGGAVDQLGQLGLSEMDLLKLAASGGLGQHGYNTRSHSAEVGHNSQHPGMQPTFSPSWPPHGLGANGDRDAAAAAAIAAAHVGQHPLMPPGGGYFPSASLGGGVAGLAAHGSLGGATDLSYLAQLGAVGSSAGLLSAAAQSAAFGEGPRIYVGGVPDLVTVAMVRDHFSRWGVVRPPVLLVSCVAVVFWEVKCMLETRCEGQGLCADPSLELCPRFCQAVAAPLSFSLLVPVSAG